MGKELNVMETKAILFDMDGTLVDTEPIGQKLFADLCVKESIAYTEQDAELFDKVWRRVGTDIDFDTFCQTLFENANQADKLSAFTANFFSAYKEAVANASELAGATELLTKLHQHYKLAIVTGSSKEQITAALKAHDWQECFDIVVPFEEYAVAKPDPKGYLTAASKLGASPSECIVIEDAESGIKAGLNADMQVIAVREGNPSQDRSLATYVVANLYKVAEILG